MSIVTYIPEKSLLPELRKTLISVFLAEMRDVTVFSSRDSGARPPGVNEPWRLRRPFISVKYIIALNTSSLVPNTYLDTIIARYRMLRHNL